MILNAYAVLDAFVSLLRLGLGLLVVGLAFSSWRLWRRSGAVPEVRPVLEDRCYLLFLTASLLLGLNVLSWPLFYLLLQSYVPEWEGVMCIYGVTRVGAGSVGPARFLPPLVTTLQAMKPALVFLSGAWFLLYLVNRGTSTAPLTGRVLLLVLLAGLLGATDAAAEGAYLVIPKKEEFLSTGCCTAALDASSRFLPATWVEEGDYRLRAAYYAVNLGMALALAAYGWRDRRSFPGWWLAPLLLGAGLSLAVNAVFLVESAAPRLLRLPYHHCPYDLVGRAPESLAAVALFLGGAFAVGWACVVGWLAGDPEARPQARSLAGQLLHFALLGYLASLAMLSLELALA
jgi:hypothetical protein